MFKKNKMEKLLLKNLEQLNYTLTKNNILSGMAKGIGIGIGFTILTAILLIMLQKIVTLNIPVIGDYIADIVEIVESKQ